VVISRVGGRKGGFAEKIREMSRLLVKWKSLERQSAITLETPGVCCENSQALCSIMSLACSLATSACICSASGSKFDLYAHPAAQFESPMLRTHGVEDESKGKFSFALIVLAKNSFKFSVSASLSCLVNSYLQARPVFRSYPPIPYSHASLRVIVVGFLNTIALIDIPWPALSRNLIHSFKSARAPGKIIA